MEITAKELRSRVGEALALVERGEQVTVTYRGKARARLVPVEPSGEEPCYDPAPASAFGMWKDRTDMDDEAAWVRNIRKGRLFAD